MTEPARRPGPRTLSRVAGALLLVQAVAIVIWLAMSEPRLFPVRASLGGDSLVLARIDLGSAVVVLVVLVGTARLLGFRERSVDFTRRTAVLIEYSFTSSIIVFLVALLNGITEVGTLVLVYAITSGMTLFTILQGRSTVSSGHPLLALCFGAAIGIVPWGIVAFYQVGAGIVGVGPSVVVRVTTLVMLASAIVVFVLEWRAHRALLDGGRIGGTNAYVLVSLVSTSSFAWLVVAGIVLLA